MPIDRAARAAQVAAVFEHVGTRFTWSHPTGTVSFLGSVEPWDIPVTTAHPNKGDHEHQGVKIAAARAVFGDKLPRQGQTITDESGRKYRIQQVPPQPATLPTVYFLCGSVVSP